MAIKLHFGEYGNTAYLRPVYLRIVVDRIKKAGGKPFLTDVNTLYKGSRSDSVSHLKTAIMNGFDYSCVGAPLIIAGRTSGGREAKKVPIEGEVLKDVSIAGEIVDADAIIAVTHVKAHELSGFGGALKNLGMGCATREGKLVQHSTVAPTVNIRACKGCKLCTRVLSCGGHFHGGQEGPHRRGTMHRLCRVHRRLSPHGRRDPVE